MNVPDFLIIGGMRCGTTTLHELLRRQSSIFFPETKEVHFFDKRNIDLGVSGEDYSDLFSACPVNNLTGEANYETWFETIQEYTWEKFPDREKGEWFGYLRRDGSVQVDLKGNHYKGPFHIPRFLMKTYKLLEKMEIA